MHTAKEARGKGVGSALVQRLLQKARELGVRRVCLETGSQEAFAPARGLYRRNGFMECAVFADYPKSSCNTFMEIALATSGTLHIAEECPTKSEIVALLETHLEFARAVTPPEAVHALDIDGLLDESVHFFACRDGAGLLLGVGALKMLSADLCEVKSMHTAKEARGKGVGSALVQRLLQKARELGVRRVCLETGSQEAFAPARALYRLNGFVECAAYGSYPDVPGSTFMEAVIRG